MTQCRSVVVHQTSQRCPFYRRGPASSTAINRSLIGPAFNGLSEQQGKDERCATDRNLTAIRTQLSHGRNRSGGFLLFRNGKAVGTIRPVLRNFPGDGPAPYRVARAVPGF